MAHSRNIQLAINKVLGSLAFGKGWASGVVYVFTNCIAVYHTGRVGVRENTKEFVRVWDVGTRYPRMDAISD